MNRPVFWELIQSNQRKSFILFAALLVCLLFLGYAVGFYAAGAGGANVGLGYALVLWGLLSLTSYFWGDSILLGASHAKEVTPEMHPMLFNVVEEMRIASGLPANPKIYIVDETAPNAFATGIRPEKSSVAVTVGLLTRLNRDELQGVVAHEMSHVANRDVLFMTLAATTLGSIQLISQALFRSGRYGSDSSRRYRAGGRTSSGGAAGAILILIIAILGPILARLFYLAISRRREYLADASAVRFTRYPEGLASALDKIAGANFPLRFANDTTAPLFIVNPLQPREQAFTSLTSTHPPIDERIQILRRMTSAGFADYEKTYSEMKKGAGLLPPSALEEKTQVPLRESHVEPQKNPKKKEAARDMGDLMRAVNHFAFFTCLCGLKFKIPPGFQHPQVSCPRCGLVNQVPFFGSIGVSEKKPLPTQTQSYTRRTRGWESFLCQCGNLLQLSPSFSGSHLTCPACQSKIMVS